MKTVLILVCTLLWCLPRTYGQDKQRNQPATLTETFSYLDKIFADDTSRYGFMTMPEQYLPMHYDMSLGKYMRSHWGLVSGSKLKRWFESYGVETADDMSGIILTSYHRHLNHLPIDIEGQIKFRHFGSTASRADSMHSIYDFKELPSQSSLLSKFPVGATMMVYTAAEKQSRKSIGPASLRAYCIVRAHRGEQLVFEIMNIETQPDTKSTRNIGDIVEGYPSECFHLPPPGWKREH